MAEILLDRELLKRQFERLDGFAKLVRICAVSSLVTDNHIAQWRKIHPEAGEVPNIYDLYRELGFEDELTGSNLLDFLNMVEDEGLTEGQYQNIVNQGNALAKLVKGEEK